MALTVKLEKSEGLERHLFVSVPQEKYQSQFDKAVKERTKTAKIDGFRSGKVPEHVVRVREGERIKADIVGRLVQETFHEAIMQESLTPTDMPEFKDIKVEPDQPVQYTAVFEVFPTIEFNSLKGLEVEKPNSKITEKDIDNMIEKVREQNKEFKDVKRAAKEGDQVLIDFRGKIDGEPFEGGEAQNYKVVLGQKQMIEDFEKGLTGLKAGDEKDINVRFPDEYHHPDFAGKDAIFTIKVHAVQASALPEVDATLVKKLGVKEGTVEALREDMKKHMERTLKQVLKDQFKHNVFEVLLEKNPVQAPKSILKRELERQKRMALSQMGMQQETDQHLSLPDEPFIERAERAVALGLLVNELVNKHDIKVDDSRIDAILEDIAGSYDDKESVLRSYKQNENMMAEVKAMAIEEQVIDYLIEELEVTEKSLSYDDAVNPKPKKEASAKGKKKKTEE